MSRVARAVAVAWALVVVLAAPSVAAVPVPVDDLVETRGTVAVDVEDPTESRVPDVCVTWVCGSWAWSVAKDNVGPVYQEKLDGSAWFCRALVAEGEERTAGDGSSPRMLWKRPGEDRAGPFPWDPWFCGRLENASTLPDPFQDGGAGDPIHHGLRSVPPAGGGPASLDDVGAKDRSASRPDARGWSVADLARATVPGIDDRAGTSLAVAAAGLGAAILLWFLYRRLSRDDLLDNDLRSAILDRAARDPGIHASELARQLDVAVTTILYHGRLLDEHGLVILRRSNGQIAFLDPEAASCEVERELVCTLRTPAKRRVLQAIRDAPGSSMADLARRLDRARTTVKHHVDELREAGLVRDDGTRGLSRIDLVPEARRAMDRR